jgi:chemotaxis protein methyltransferase CheR
MNYQWKGFRKVRRQVCKRLQRRLTELEFVRIEEYREYLNENKQEWETLDSLLNITISRFYRDPQIFRYMETLLFPTIIQNTITKKSKRINIWSIGCCSGEEPYSLNLVWQLSFPISIRNRFKLDIVATDSSPVMLKRANKASYTPGSIRFLPENHIKSAFVQRGKEFELKQEFRKNITFLQQDIRKEFPDGQFDIILCRNLAFTYFRKQLQQEILSIIDDKLRIGGYLIIGSHEKLPITFSGLQPIPECKIIFQKVLSTD